MKITNLKYIIYLIIISKFTLPSNAQITIDNKSQFNTNIKRGSNIINIGGGSKRYGFVRHKFSDFNVRKNENVVFNLDKNLQSILVEVTGKNVSFINGGIGANRKSNILLVNPKGFIFGNESLINLNGSFVISTANSLDFINKNLQLNFDNNSGRVKIIGSGHNRINLGSTRLRNIFAGAPPTGLDLSPESSFQIIAGEINLDGGIINAPSGRIGLTGVKSGRVLLYPSPIGFTLENEITNLGDIALQNRSFLNASGIVNGDIYLRANSIDIDDASLIHVENFGVNNLGEISLNASKIRISGVTPNVAILQGFSSYSRGISSVSNEGKSSDIQIKADSLKLENQGNIVSYAEGSAIGADISINTTQDVVVDGSTPFNPTLPLGSFLGSLTRGRGDSGNVSIRGRNLSLLSGGSIQAITLDEGNGGNIEIKVSGNLKLDGLTPISNIPSIITSLSVGTIDNRPSGKGGDVRIWASTIFLENSGRIDSSTLSDGPSGNTSISAKDIKIMGGIGENNSQIISSADNVNPFLQREFSLSDLTGDSGSIDIQTETMSILDGGEITVRNNGTGIGGTINIEAENYIRVDFSEITSKTNAGDGGSTFIIAGAAILNSGMISASSSGEGVGGNIGIQTELFATKGKSSIEANAENNFAGSIETETSQLISRGNTTFSASSDSGTSFDGQVDLTQGQENVNFMPEIADETSFNSAVTSQCTDRGQVSNHGSGINPLSLSETQYKALRLKHRLDIANHFTYLDPNTGQRKPFKRWQGIQRNNEGNLEFVFSPNQSEALQNMLSSLNNICLMKS